MSDDTPNYPESNFTSPPDPNVQIVCWGSTEGNLILADDGITVLGVELTHKEFHGPEEK